MNNSKIGSPITDRVSREKREAAIRAANRTALDREKAIEEMEKQDKRRAEQDKRYAIIISIICKEIERRNIVVSSSDFNSKLDEVIQMVLENPIFKQRFENDNPIDIRNAVKRKINSNKTQDNVGDEQR